ncbi:kinase-like protein [Rhizophagus irregularis]|uniref:Kinase-like protein n=1 Tax=Rhizophagus irregularis TaxID=588596 RepID=A0A2N0QXL7_9GLOM|nr:kinase-like protein [Rhizophagus irregularis]
MCQPANKQKVKEEGIYGVLPYMAPEVLRGHQYTKAADIYSFGIIMNELLSEEIPFNDISHNEFLAIKICKGLRPTISKDVPMLLADLIIKCWDAEIENRPTTKELYQILTKWNDEIEDIEGSEDSEYSEDDEDGEDSENGEKSEYNGDGEDGEDGENVKDSENCDNSQNSKIYFQIKECDKIRKEKFKNRSNEDKSKSFKTHPQAFYTSRLLNFKNLPKPINSSDVPSFQVNSDDVPSVSTNLISE